MALTSIALEGSHTYKFRIVKVSNGQVFFIDSPNPTIDLSKYNLFKTGEAYHVRIRITGHPSFAAYGSNCTVMIAAANDCQSEITHDNQILVSGDYLSSSTIISEAIIAANSTIAYQAATFIDLLPDFYAESGSTFSASIEDCEVANPLNVPSLGLQKISTAEQVVQNTLTLSINPNPFTGTTLIAYKLLENSVISLDLYALTGKKLKSITYKKTASKGSYHQILDMEMLPKGMYLLVLKNEFEIVTKKIVNK